MLKIIFTFYLICLLIICSDWICWTNSLSCKTIIYWIFW